MTHLAAAPGTARPAVPVTGRAVLATAAGCSLVAAATHLYVVPEHAEEWPAAAVFFVVLAVLQVVLAAVLLRRPGPRVLESAAVATVALVVFYVLTRTVDLPLLPPLGAHGASHLPVAWGIGNGVPVFPGEGVEEVGTPDLVCLVAELATVVLLVGVLPPAARRRVGNVAVAAALVLVTLRVAGVPG
jgi:hypothetical protein